MEDEDIVVDEHEAARRRVHSRRDFAASVVAYVVVNAALIVVWAASGAGYFWPGWIIGLWGVALLLGAWKRFVRRPMTEDDIDAEMRRHQH